MENYLIYVGVAIVTILLPGPAVMLTINNSIQRGLSKSFIGIIGIALAILLVAIISATSLGIVLASSAIAFNIIKIIGAVYLIYLGFKMWHRKDVSNVNAQHHQSTPVQCFTEGFLVSMSNPKAVVFFISIFPQFIDVAQEYTPQFFLLAVTFSILVVIIHSIYAILASFTKSRLLTPAGNTALNKVSGGVFVGFGIGLATSSK